MEDLEHVIIVAQQVPQRGQVDPGCERVDRSGFFTIADLHEAEFGPEGVLAHEFGVDAHEFVLAQPLAQFRQRFGFGYKFVDFHRIFSFLSGGVPPPGRGP